MRLDQNDTSAFNTNFRSGKFSQSTKVLTQNVNLVQNGSIVNVFDPNGGTFNVRLPALESGRFYVITNTGVAGTLNVTDLLGALVTSLAPGVSTLLFAGDDSWNGVAGSSALNAFGGVGAGHSTGLVPDPGVGPASSPHKYLSETGVFETVAGLVASNAYFYSHKGGAVTVTPIGSETLEFLSANTAISILGQSGTSPKSMLFTLNAANIDHNTLLNYSADQHVAHSGVTLTAGLGISGGGTIAASRSFDFAPTELTAAPPALTDYAVWDLAAGGPRKGLWSAVNGIFDHNALVNYSLNRHIDHSGVSIVASTGLSGGGDITSSRSLALDLNSLTTDVPAVGDFLGFYDISGGDHNKVAMSGLNAILDHNALLNYAPNQHFADATSDGVRYARRNAAWSALPNITVSAVAPSSPAVNDVWIDTT